MLMLPTAPDVLDLLSAIPVPAVAPWSERTRHSRWRPIQHGLLARTLLEEAEDQGLEVLRHGWEVAGPGGTDLFGSIDLKGGSRVQMPDGLCFSIGLRHSNAGRYALTLVTGARVMVCSNGVLAGERVLARRHTDDLDVRDVVRAGLADSIARASSVGTWVQHLLDTKVSPQKADRLMMEGARKRILPWSALRKVDHAWRCPPHEVFRPRTAWSLYNAFTEAARERKPAAQLKALRGLRGLFSGAAVAGLPSPGTSPDTPGGVLPPAT